MSCAVSKPVIYLVAKMIDTLHDTFLPKIPKRSPNGTMMVMKKLTANT